MKPRLLPAAPGAWSAWRCTLHLAAAGQRGSSPPCPSVGSAPGGTDFTRRCQLTEPVKRNAGSEPTVARQTAKRHGLRVLRHTKSGNRSSQNYSLNAFAIKQDSTLTVRSGNARLLAFMREHARAGQPPQKVCRIPRLAARSPLPRSVGLPTVKRAPFSLLMTA